MSDLALLRDQIDQIDEQIFDLFSKRASVAGEIGTFKREKNMAVYDAQREREKVRDAANRVPDDISQYARVLMELLMECGRSKQKDEPSEDVNLVEALTTGMLPSDAYLKQDAFVAVQGVEGAFSQAACSKFFKYPKISYFNSFEGVFKAVEQGFCSYGVVPVENSSAGSVNQVYDLMMRHKCYIVRTTRIKVEHCLLAPKGTTLEDIREVYSHEQAISQCQNFLDSLPNVHVHVCENTAMAAEEVANSGRTDVAALSSIQCADLYDLALIKRDVQDFDANYTRFAVISKRLEIFPGANRTAFVASLPHRPGSLYKLLGKFFALDVNLIKLESRPIPGRDFEFMFYFDIDCPVSAPEFTQLMGHLHEVCEDLKYLGSYSEVL